ncbi:8-oxo-dGTP pyrophosphatase MutT (NUDIX family) [Alkalihalobacillus xiaoxiensis]|uniref:8-oxo-dGTP pyrophosphatase MutT (NUDIX family) n=1 Tax=Shouchella xiaoxiensis TaxID=766895 RepID=A0ABS2SP43_9BACI|nr:NUDIX domain-containing protein [Shouchella xiaoxiensis]MBM7836926.1 8-oxo-dGTP pyrophosphatase MutT (NUDIX family) [Shouchella xiaoxiensis]
MKQDSIVLVASVTVMRDDSVLLIKENKPTARNKWNFPSGRIERGEEIFQAALREVKEETGLAVKLMSTTGVYQFQSNTNDQVILFHFMAEVVGGELSFSEEEIIEGKWFRINELSRLEKDELREPTVLTQIINNVVNGKTHTIDLFHN